MPESDQASLQASGTAVTAPAEPARGSGAAEPGPAAGSSAAAAATMRSLAARLRVSPVTIGVAVAIAVAALTWFQLSGEVNRVRDDVARRVQQSDLETREGRLVAREAQEAVRESQSRIAALESKLAESQSHQIALEQLYQDLSRGRDEWVVAEIEQAVVLASQQLQLAGNVHGALVALETADARLARADRPQFIPLRKVLNRDIDRLKALPAVDLPGLTLKLDEITRTIEQLPLLADGQPLGSADAALPEGSLWQRVTTLVWSEVKQLIRVQRLESADQGLLSPEQSYFLRENLKLRLAHARLALLQRNDPVFRTDLRTAIDWLNRYFDTRQSRVSASIATLDQLASTVLNIDLPTLGDSLGAIRTFKAGGEKAGA